MQVTEKARLGARYLANHALQEVDLRDDGHDGRMKATARGRDRLARVDDGPDQRAIVDLELGLALLQR